MGADGSQAGGSSDGGGTGAKLMGASADENRWSALCAVYRGQGLGIFAEGTCGDS